MTPRKLSICSFGEPFNRLTSPPFLPFLEVNQMPSSNVSRSNAGSLRGSHAIEVCEFYGIAAGDVDGSTITLRQHHYLEAAPLP